MVALVNFHWQILKRSMFKTISRKVGFQLREKKNVDYVGRAFQAEGTF